MGLNLIKKIEAILFLEVDQIEITALAKNLDVEQNICLKEIKELEKYYKKNNMALTLVFNEDQIQLVLKPEMANFVEKYFHKKTKKEQFSPAMMEVLSIIVYKGPIGKVGIEKIRGVNSDLILRKLAIKGLIERAEQIKNSRIFVYKPSLKLLKKLGVSKLENLSEYDKLSSELKNFG